MGLASGGNLDEQHKLRPFNVQEISLILRQMLNALCYLHLQFSITHRDLKPANILCDDRSHYRLADFGLAKKGNVLKTFNGTAPWMAPEMFEDTSYTAAVDVWALGMVIARYLTRGRPGGYTGEEGARWCAAVVAHFQNYLKRSEAATNKEPERTRLNTLVGQHMLRLKPEERKSAPGCIELLDQDSEDDSNTIPEGHQNETFSNGLPLDNANAGSEEDGLKEDGDTEAVTEVRSLNTNEWLSLEREHALDENERESVPQQFIDGNFSNDPENLLEDSASLPDSDGESEPEPSLQREQNESPAVPTGEPNQSQKRKWSSK